MNNPWIEPSQTWTHVDDLLLNLATCDYWADRNRAWVEAHGLTTSMDAFQDDMPIFHSSEGMPDV